MLTGAIVRKEATGVYPMDKAIAIYARVSQDEQAKDYSLPTQLDGCRKFAAEKG
jgi:hypothetical protein